MRRERYLLGVFPSPAKLHNSLHDEVQRKPDHTKIHLITRLTVLCLQCSVHTTVERGRLVALLPSFLRDPV